MPLDLMIEEGSTTRKRLWWTPNPPTTYKYEFLSRVPLSVVRSGATTTIPPIKGNHRKGCSETLGAQDVCPEPHLLRDLNPSPSDSEDDRTYSDPFNEGWSESVRHLLFQPDLLETKKKGYRTSFVKHPELLESREL